MDFNSWNIVWSPCFGLLATVVVVGNLLTIWMFLKQRLDKRAHFLLISLAVADLLVGLLAVPLYIAINTALHFGELLGRSVFVFTDIFTAIASISTLAAISLERMHAIGWPFRHRTLNFRVYVFAIAISWILTTIFTSIRLLFYLSVITLKYYMFSFILLVSTPLLVMCIAYSVVWRKQKTTMGNWNHVVRDKRWAKTLFIITTASLLTWFPFQILSLLAIRGELEGFPNISMTVNIVTFLQFSNSFVNSIIYPFRIPEFKNALLQMLRCWSSPRGRRIEVVPMHQRKLGQLPNH